MTILNQIIKSLFQIIVVMILSGVVLNIAIHLLIPKPVRKVFKYSSKFLGIALKKAFLILAAAIKQTYSMCASLVIKQVKAHKAKVSNNNVGVSVTRYNKDKADNVIDINSKRNIVE